MTVISVQEDVDHNNYIFLNEAIGFSLWFRAAHCSCQVSRPEHLKLVSLNAWFSQFSDPTRCRLKKCDSGHRTY